MLKRPLVRQLSFCNLSNCLVFVCIFHLSSKEINSCLIMLTIQGKPVNDVGVIKADVEDPNSLAEMAKQGKIVLNCVGPYRYNYYTLFSVISLNFNYCFKN